jgi:VWFA-related protein
MVRRLPALPLVLAAAAVVAADAVPVSGQFRTSVDLVRVEALVTDGGGRPVDGLTAADFRVTDNGAPQTVTVRPLTDAAIDVVIALDTSLSVRGERLAHLRAATTALLARLAPRDRATLIAFSHEIALGPADAAPGALATRLADLDAGGATSLIDAATAALVWASGRDRPSLALVFSDGRDTASWTRGEQALALARGSDAVVDAIVAGELAASGPGFLRVSEGIPSRQSRRTQPTLSTASATPTEETRLTAERFLTNLTGLTGGLVVDGDGDGLAASFAASLARFRTRYEIIYTATSADPGWHAIDLRVTSRRGLTVRARRGYQR